MIEPGVGFELDVARQAPGLNEDALELLYIAVLQLPHAALKVHRAAGEPLLRRLDIDRGFHTPDLLGLAQRKG